MTFIVVTKELFEKLKNTYVWDRSCSKYCNVKFANDKVEIDIDALKLYQTLYPPITKSVINNRIYKLISAIFEVNEQLDAEGVISINIDMINFISNAIQLFDKLDKEQRQIDFDNNCNIIVTPSVKFDEISYLLKAWDNKPIQYSETKLLYPLIHPSNYEYDLELLQKNGFIVNITEEIKQKLELLKQEEIKRIKTVYILPSQRGYKLVISPLASNYINFIVEKATVRYYKRQGTSVEVVKLKFIDKVPDDNLTEEDKKYKLQGYDIYDCFTFTFYPIYNYLIQNDFTVNGKLEFTPEPINIHMEKKYNMEGKWSYQKDAYDSWVKNNYMGVIQVPTAGGKTHIGLEAIYNLRVKTVIVVPTIELLFQVKRMLTEYLDINPNDIGLLYGGEKSVDKPIVVATYMSSRRFKELEEEENEEEEPLTREEEELVSELCKLIEKAGLLIMDEAHHCPAPVFMRIMTAIKTPYRMGLTCMVEREDRNEALVFLALGQKVYTISYYDLALREVTAPIIYNKIFVPLSKDEIDIIQKYAINRAEVRRLASEKAQGIIDEYSYIEERKRLDLEYKGIVEMYEKLPVRLAWNNYIQYTPNTNTKKRLRIIDILRFSINKFRALEDIVKQHINDKIIIFNQRVIGAMMIYDYLKGAFPNLSIWLLYGSTEKYERKQIFEQFRKADKGIMVTTVVLDEGIDVPDANVVIIFNGSKSPKQQIQRIGRGARWKPKKIEYVYELVATYDISKLIKNDAEEVKKYIIREMIERLRQGYAFSNMVIRPYYRFHLDDKDYEILKWILSEEAISQYRDITKINQIDRMPEVIEKFKMEGKL